MGGHLELAHFEGNAIEKEDWMVELISGGKETRVLSCGTCVGKNLNPKFVMIFSSLSWRWYI